MGVSDAIGDAWRGLDAAKRAAEAEQQQAGDWGN
jgi:hypothetical protein